MALTLNLAPLAPTRTEQDLVAAARAGDDRAFEELYSRYRERIFSFILAKVHDHGRAEDIAQDVFISALKRLRATEREVAFKPWIYEIAKNACIDEFRRSKRTREVSLDVDDELSGTGRGLLSVAPTPPAAVESKQRLDDLQGAFSGLSESHHKLLVMREFEGLSYNEIGARTGMSRQVVESTLFRARRKLTEEYDEIASGRRCEQIMALIDESGAQALRSCGIRQRRQLTRHLAHCQPCRRQARLAGVDESLVKPRSIAAKIAALLPFPLWRWPWGGKGAGKGAAVKSGSSQLGGAGSLQSAAATVASSAGPSITLGQAAVAATALVVVGAGGGAVTGAWSANHPSRPAAKAISSPGGHAVGSGAAARGAGAGAATQHGRAAGVSQPKVQLQSPSSHAATGAGAVTGKPGKSPAQTKPVTGKGVTGTGPGTAASKKPAPGQPVPPSISSTLKSVADKVKSVTTSTKSTLSGVVNKVAPKNGPVSQTLHKAGQTVHKVLPGSGSVTSTVNNTTHKVVSTVSNTTHKVVSTVNNTTSKVTSTANHTASQLTATAKDTTQKVASTVDHAASTVSNTTSKVTSGAGNVTAGPSAKSSPAGNPVSSAKGAAEKAGSTVSKTVGGLLP